MFLYLVKKGVDPNELTTHHSFSELVMARPMDPQPSYPSRKKQSYTDERQEIYKFIEATLPTWVQHGGDIRHFRTHQFGTSTRGSTLLLKVVKHGDSRVLRLFLDAAAATVNNDNSNSSSDSISSALSDIVNMPSGSNETPLLGCILSLLNNTEKEMDRTSLEYLLDAGADINFKYTNKGASILMKVVSVSNIPIMKIIFEKSKHPIDHMVVNTAGNTPLLLATRTKNPAFFDFYFDQLLKDCSSSDISDLINGNTLHNVSTCLAAPILKNQLSIVKRLLQHGADPNIKGVNDTVHLFQAVSNGFNDIVACLLEAGADPNVSVDGDSILHLAILKENLQATKLLLQHGANVNTVNTKLQTPFHYAISMTMKQMSRTFRIERLLLETGKININAVDMLGRTALHLVFTEKDIIPVMHTTQQQIQKYLQLREQERKSKEKEDQMKGQEKEENNKDIWKTRYLDQYGGIARDWFEHSYNKVSEYLQIKECQQNKDGNDSSNNKDDDKDILMISAEEQQVLEPYKHFLFSKNYSDMSPQNDPIDVVKFLSAIPGILMDIKDKFGRLALHYAAMVGAFTCTTFFLDKHNYINSEDLDQNTPLHLALLYGRVDYAVMLYNCGATPNALTLRSGVKESIFSYAVRKSYLNVVYLDLGKYTNIVDGLQVVLQTGNYYLASMLLQSADNETLLSLTKKTKQTFWHLISNFVPTKRDVWQDYLPLFVEKLCSLDLELTADIYGRTPIHYAAKSNQMTILKHLLSRPNCPLNQLDVDGYSELWYAVSARNIDAVKMLLENGSMIQQASQLEKNLSLLSQAVIQGDIGIVNLLVMKGCGLDEDSGYGRSSPLMLSICDGNIDMVKTLVKHGAKVNQQSLLSSNSHSIVVHPLFAASLQSADMLTVLLEAGASPNALGPQDSDDQVDEMDERKAIIQNMKNASVFAFNLRMKNKAYIKLLLDTNAVDLNSSYYMTGRTLFTQVFFEYCDGSDSNIFWKDIYEWIYEDYMKKQPEYTIQVNIVDKITGRTPLEAAIRLDRQELIENLMTIGADPNLKSCQLNAKANDQQEQVNAIFHCILNDKYKALRLIYANSKIPIDWAYQDSRGRTTISCLVTMRYPYIRDVSIILKDLASAMGPNYLQIFAIPDNEGFMPIEYAAVGGCKDVYQTLRDLGLRQSEKEPAISQTLPTNPMDYISLHTVEKDAEAERDLLQAQKDELKSQTDTPDDLVPVDPLSGLDQVGKIVYENDEPLDIMIMKVDVNQNSYGCNMFYKMSVIYNQTLKLYVLWTRWGTFGEDGWHQKAPYQDKDDAIREFKSIFQAKTANEWDDRHAQFVYKPGKFDMIKAKVIKDVIMNPSDFDVLEERVPSTLSHGLMQTISVIFSFAEAKLGYHHLDMELPIGQIPQSSIDQAMSILNELEPKIGQYILMRISVTTMEKQEARQQLIHTIGQATNDYYRLLPRPSDFKNGGIEPLLTKAMLERERARLLEISYVNFSANVLLAARYRSSEIHHLDYAYRALGCQLTEIFPSSSFNEYEMINQYIQSTTANDDKYEIANLFMIQRQNENERYAQYKYNSNRKLLWHGSRIDNYMGILNQGLLCKPPRAQETGAMFGNGIYFADMFCKSVNYSRSTKRPAYATLLLCEVALGEECEMNYYYDPDLYQPKNKGHLSVKGLGRWRPDPINTIYDQYGVKIPLGPATQAPPMKDDCDYSLRYNEYIVYNPAQVKMRYLVMVRDKSRCYICEKQQANGSLKPLKDHTFQDYTPSFNAYDRELARVYLVHKKGAEYTYQMFYDQELDDYLKTKDFSDKRHLLMKPITRETEVCTTCGINIMDDIIKMDMAKHPHIIPVDIRTRPLCNLDEKCHLQTGQQAHNQQYRHW
ncbi:poly polymerase catalytic domain-containing protein [Halteromyces radiatus]|uniref:poly polymerase catalytic domain-containing protein n=1 Tax=Halteromyces radiatus TaxID=101107 RepID=UPI002220966C|nr:poly polymerase catalytic domain-containing protein [Halteromyces radiatus]KAI8089183.1 poly polymerase catalytic domain-containing protein [Halteromyces radiatus]